MSASISVSTRRTRGVVNKVCSNMCSTLNIPANRFRFSSTFLTLIPPQTPLPPRTNAVAIISSLATKCPETMCCVVAPLVVGCVLVFNGFQNYIVTKESKMNHSKRVSS